MSNLNMRELNALLGQGKRRRKKPVRGAGWFSDSLSKLKQHAGEALKKVHDVAKERKVLSASAKQLGWNNVSNVLKERGYGRRRKKPVAGKGIFGDAGAWLGGQAGNAIGGLLGFGKKRRARGRGTALRNNGANAMVAF
jgi:hypothetical protein